MLVAVAAQRLDGPLGQLDVAVAHGRLVKGDAPLAQLVDVAARLARLELTEANIEQYRAQLGAVLGYFQRLQTLDLEGVEPMSHVIGADADETMNRLELDEEREPLPNEALMRMAPDRAAPFIRVPKVLEG